MIKNNESTRYDYVLRCFTKENRDELKSKLSIVTGIFKTNGFGAVIRALNKVIEEFKKQ